MKLKVPLQLSRRRFRLPWRSLIAVLIVTLLLMAQPMGQAVEASQRVEFRVSRLESETRSLRSQINRLESQINRLSRTTGDSRPNPTVTPPAAESAADGTDLPFDQLATLVIETRQDMFRLEEQVAAIANQLNSSLPDEATP